MEEIVSEEQFQRNSLKKFYRIYFPISILTSLKNLDTLIHDFYLTKRKS